YVEGVSRSGRVNLGRVVEDNTTPGCAVYTGAWSGYARLGALDRSHAAVCHTPGKREWARGDDGGGGREVHDNTLGGVGTGPGNFLGPFRGVSKHHLDRYVAVFQWAHNLKTATDEFLRTLLGTKPGTNLAT